MRTGALSTVILGLAALALPASIPAGEVESCEFRVVNWNTAGSGANDGNDIHVALSVFNHVTWLDANVITLQEVTDVSLSHLETLLPGWDCSSQLFGVDSIAVCVDGTAAHFSAKSLSPDPDKPDPDPPDFPWWGYVQVEYQGALITSVHTRSFWRDHHRVELHADVTTGIVAGDFNHIDAADPDWYQTDPDLEWTWEGEHRGMDGQWKIDHVLSVEEPQTVWGDAVEKHGSDHRVVLAEITYPAQGPRVDAAITNTQHPIEVDGGCFATATFQIDIHDNCCLDPSTLALDVMASNPTTNATLGPVSIDSVVALGPRDVEVTGHVDVSALQSCPAELVIEASAQDCAGNVADTVSQGTSASRLVVDTLPPQVVGSDSDLYCLWPPSHDYVCLDAGGFTPVITDNCTASPPWAFDGCTSNQPDNDRGDGNTINDCVLDADAQGFCARSERAGHLAEGRRYDVYVRAVDTCANVSAPTEIGNIFVPHEQNPAQMCAEPRRP